MKLSENWQIFIAGVIFTLVFLEIIIPLFKKWFLTKHPDTHLFLYRQSASAEGTYFLNILAENKGKGIDSKVKINLALNPNNSSIKSIKMHSPDRVKLIEGGKMFASYAVFYIEELLPEEKQIIEITAKGKDVKSFEAWSKEKQGIKKVFILDVTIGPEEKRPQK